MKLKRICKVEYDENDKAIIPQNERLKYDVYFIDTEDWLCIDEDEYTPEKLEARRKENRKRYDTYVYAPYISFHTKMKTLQSFGRAVRKK